MIGQRRGAIATFREEAYFEAMRRAMVAGQIAYRGVRDESVLEAMRRVPRHRFVPESLWPDAYSDCPLPIGRDQTISQPYIVAFMTELLNVGRGSRVLEIGTGSGYQAAVLAELGCEVFSVEIVRALADGAWRVLHALGYTQVHIRCCDGYEGWPLHQPFDGVLVAAAPDHVPQALVDQLKEGGRLVLPVGVDEQHLFVIEKDPLAGVREWSVIPVRFVPMTGQAAQPHEGL